MMHYNNFRRMARTAAVLTAVLVMTFASCTKVDDTLGSNLVPDNQQMKAGYTTLGAKWLDGELNPKQYVQTRLFQTDSIISSNLGTGYMGSMLNDTFGLRTAGFMTQYLCYSDVDSGYFGFRPIFDSAQMLITIATYGGDTTKSQTFSVYEITSNKYLTDKPVGPKKTERDTIFYLGFDPAKENLLGDKLFTFDLGGDKGPATTAVTMEPTQAGKEFIERLMLQKGTVKDDYSIYSKKADSLKLWVDTFKGFYIVPDDETTYGEGAVYATTLDASGFSVYGRNRVEADPTLIKDTLSILYVFYSTKVSTEYGNVSINCISHDYAKAKPGMGFNPQDAAEDNEDRPLMQQMYVEGMGGVVSEITFTPEFFEQLETEIAENGDGKDFRTLAFTQARMSIYFSGSNYNWEKLNDVPHLIGQMNAAQTRLGLYTDYKTLTGIIDYNYFYEKNYEITLNYGGEINRSRGCYVMDITGYLQELWNSYLEQKKAAGGIDGIDWDKVEHRKIYAAPEAYDLYTPKYSVMQGMTPADLTDKDAPIRIDIAYNLIK